jgi:hypothetical protein
MTKAAGKWSQHSGKQSQERISDDIFEPLYPSLPRCNVSLEFILIWVLLIQKKFLFLTWFKWYVVTYLLLVTPKRGDISFAHGFRGFSRSWQGEHGREGQVTSWWIGSRESGYRKRSGPDIPQRHAPTGLLSPARFYFPVSWTSQK